MLFPTGSKGITPHSLPRRSPGGTLGGVEGEGRPHHPVGATFR